MYTLMLNEKLKDSDMGQGPAKRPKEGFPWDLRVLESQLPHKIVNILF